MLLQVGRVNLFLKVRSSACRCLRSSYGLSLLQVIPHGLACQSGLRVGDRILEVNAIDLRHATHQEAVRALLANKQEIRMLVRRDPSPPGMQARPSNRHKRTQGKCTPRRS